MKKNKSENIGKCRIISFIWNLDNKNKNIILSIHTGIKKQLPNRKRRSQGKQRSDWKRSKNSLEDEGCGSVIVSLNINTTKFYLILTS